MKKLISILTVIITVLNISTSVFAYTYPSALWKVKPSYDNALSNQNYADIVKYGNQVLEIMLGAEEGQEKTDVLLTGYKEVGLAYAALGDYDNSAKTFDALYNYAKTFGDRYSDYVLTSKARRDQYASSISLYTDNGTSPYYGAKNEKNNGVLFGTCANGETRGMLEHESLLLTYQELGQDLLVPNINVIEEAAEKGLAVEFALNCPNEGEDIENIHSKEQYLKQISDMLNNYPDVPVYLRFAAEFDAWSRTTDADSFKNAFRYVADYFHQRNSNTAIVWSVNYVSNTDINIDDYYPGDEYVDWVGVSLYAQKYFLGDQNQPDEYEVVFKSGKNSNPIIVLKDLVEKYGSKKPIMISESGCGHKLLNNSAVIENTEEFALERLEQYLAYIPMIYPQVKAMAYFDWHVNSPNEKNDYRLSSNSLLQQKYIELTKGSRFVSDKYSNNVNFAYRKVTDGIRVNSVFPISCYAHSYNSNLKSVTYFINGNYVGMSYDTPYTIYVDASPYIGNAELKAVAEFTDGKTLVTSSNIIIDNTNLDITVKISGNEVKFDQNPLLYNARTMVPLRKIFEELGASVTWDGDTQTATGRHGNTTVKITVGSPKMYVNDKGIILDIPPIVLSGATLVPARAIAEGLGCDVDWDKNTNTVIIEKRN